MLSRTKLSSLEAAGVATAMGLVSRMLCNGWKGMTYGVMGLPVQPERAVPDLLCRGHAFSAVNSSPLLAALASLANAHSGGGLSSPGQSLGGYSRQPESPASSVSTESFGKNHFTGMS